MPLEDAIIHIFLTDWSNFLINTTYAKSFKDSRAFHPAGSWLKEARFHQKASGAQFWAAAAARNVPGLEGNELVSRSGVHLTNTAVSPLQGSVTPVSPGYPALEIKTIL